MTPNLSSSSFFSTSLLSRKSNKGSSASSSLRSSSNQTGSPSQSLPPSHAVSYEDLGHRYKRQPSSQTSSPPVASGKLHRKADGNKRTSRSSTLSSTSSRYAAFPASAPATSMYKNTKLGDQAWKSRFPGDKSLDLDPPHRPRAYPVSRARPTPRCHGCSDSAGRQQCAVKCVHMVKACTACSKKADAGDR